VIDIPDVLLVLGYPISANRYWATTAKFGHATTYVTKEAKQYKKDCAWAARQAGVREPLKGRIALSVDLYPKRPQDYLKRIKLHGDAWSDTVMSIDLGNCEKVLSDALNGICWEDDKQLWDIHLRRRDPDEHGARCFVTIQAITPCLPQTTLL
jgi:crossover junction endodeoxyribonuclease RusA